MGKSSSIRRSGCRRRQPLEAYGKVFGKGLWLRIFLNSYFVAGATTLVAITLGALAAYGMSRFAFRGKRLLEFFVVGTQQIPPVAMIIPFFALIRYFDLYDTHLALIITYASFALPLAILMLTTYFATIPIELEESAFIDGAGRLRMLWTIMRPLAWPGIVATGVFAFILSFQDLLFAVQLTVSDDIANDPARHRHAHRAAKRGLASDAGRIRAGQHSAARAICAGTAVFGVGVDPWRRQAVGRRS